MALPTLLDLKNYLRLEDTTVEDEILTVLLASATAKCQAYVERPFVAELREFVDPAETSVAYGKVTTLSVPLWPVHLGDDDADPPIPAPVITDQDDGVVDASTYRVDSRSGRFIAKRGESFSNGPYTIAAYVGLSADPQYANVIEPAIKQAILDTASDLYSNRSPGANMEIAGGVSTQWQKPEPGGLPGRAKMVLDTYKPLGFG